MLFIALVVFVALLLLRIMTVDKTARMLMLVVACMLFSMICWTMLARS